MLFEVARLRSRARELGLSELVMQGRNLRVGKIEPKESVQLRIARIYKGVQYRPLTHQYLIPTPFQGSMGSGPMNDDDVLAWTNQLLDDLTWTPKARK